MCAGCFASDEFVCELHHNLGTAFVVGADGSVDYDNPGSTLVASEAKQEGATCYSGRRFVVLQRAYMHAFALS